jgi:hypothetical protein
MVTKYSFTLLFSLVLFGCDPLGHHECVGDTYAHDLTDTKLEWFSYGLFDTLYFLNTITGDTNFLYCVKEEIYNGSDEKDDRDCPDGIRTKYFKRMSSKFRTNFPHSMGVGWSACREKL